MISASVTRIDDYLEIIGVWNQDLVDKLFAWTCLIDNAFFVSIQKFFAIFSAFNKYPMNVREQQLKIIPWKIFFLM